MTAEADSTWAACSTQCGDGVRARYVTCRSTASRTLRDETECAGEFKPLAQRNCSESSSCAWECSANGTVTVTNPAVRCTAGSELALAETSTWPACPVDCGSAVATRVVGCVNSYLAASAAGRTVDDKFCNANFYVGQKPAVNLPCSGSKCVYQWYCSEPGSTVKKPCSEAPSWGPCGTTCGESTQRRTVQCLDQTGGAGACVTAAPADSQTCQATETCRWQCRAPLAANETGMTDAQLAPTFSACSDAEDSAAWSGCSATCGAGVRTREVVCHTADYSNSSGSGSNSSATVSNAAVLSDAFCPATGPAGAKPAVQGPCTTSKCSHSWFCSANATSAERWCPEAEDSAEHWSACSAGCGTGTQTRRAVCRDLATGSESTLCTEAQPALSRACSSSRACAWLCNPLAGSAFAGAAAVSCDDGGAGGSWGTCSAVCGPGSQTRAKGCFSLDTGVAVSVAAELCAGAVAPATEQQCQAKACTFSWHCYGDTSAVSDAKPCAQQPSWGVCGSTCGLSKQHRNIVCLNDDTKALAADAVACGPAASAPPLEQECYGSSTCRWMCRSPSQPATAAGECVDTVTAWGSCGATCGAGVKTRIVECRPGAAGAAVGGTAESDMLCPQTTAGTKPATTTPCRAATCQNSWFCYTEDVASATLCDTAPNWGVCSNSCGIGSRSRKAVCLDITTRKVRVSLYP